MSDLTKWRKTQIYHRWGRLHDHCANVMSSILALIVLVTFFPDLKYTVYSMNKSTILIY